MKQLHYVFGRPLALSFLLYLAFSTSTQAATIPAIWEPNVGPSVLNADDSTVVVNFGFAFPFLGNTYTSGSLSSNGFLWLNSANTDAGCCNGNAADFVAGDPRIAAGWFDLISRNTGNTDFNTFANRAVITYEGVPEFGDGTNLYTFQIQLYSTGRIVFGYDTFQSPNSHDQLIGVTPGLGDSDPGSSDFLNGPVQVSSNGTVYQEISGLGGSDPPFEGTNIIFDPSGDNGWTVQLTDVPEPGGLALMGLGAAAMFGSSTRFWYKRGRTG